MLKLKSFTFGPVQENTYLLYDDSGSTAIIDCGVSNFHEQNRLKDFIDTNNLDVNMLINTHMHFDHAMGNPWAKETFPDIVCYAPHKDIDGMPSVVEQMKSFMPIVQGNLDLPKNHYTDINDGYNIRLGDTDIVVLDVPGHSPGHVALYIKEQNIVMSGDTLFCEGIGRTDLWGGDYATLINSIRIKLLTLPDDTFVYSGHGIYTTIGYERVNNPFL